MKVARRSRWRHGKWVSDRTFSSRASTPPWTPEEMGSAGCSGCAWSEPKMGWWRSSSSREAMVDDQWWIDELDPLIPCKENKGIKFDNA